MFENHNNKDSIKTVRDGIDTTKLGDFQNIKNFLGQTIKVDGFFFTKSKYGEQVVVVGNGALINIPKRYTEDFKAIRDNADELKAVLDGKLTLTDIKEVDAKNGKTVAFTFTG